MTPYLIGLHMTIDSWRDNRDAEGWRVKPRGEPLLMSKNQEQRREGPKKVKAVPRLPEDLEALVCLVSATGAGVLRFRGRVRVKSTVLSMPSMANGAMRQRRLSHQIGGRRRTASSMRSVWWRNMIWGEWSCSSSQTTQRRKRPFGRVTPSLASCLRFSFDLGSWK
jgi:hypothetical protein